MKKESIFRSTLVLTVCCLLASAMLGYAYVATKDKIGEQAKLALDAKLKELFPEATSFVEKDDYYIAQQDKSIIGYIAISQAPGYNSMLRVVVGMDLNKKVTGIRILEQSETPGLGTGVANPDFYNQFKGLDSSSIMLKKYNGKIDGITGATISSKAVTNAVSTALKDKIEKLVDGVNTKSSNPDETESAGNYSPDATTSATKSVNATIKQPANNPEGNI